MASGLDNMLYNAVNIEAVAFQIGIKRLVRVILFSNFHLNFFSEGILSTMEAFGFLKPTLL